MSFQWRRYKKNNFKIGNSIWAKYCISIKCHPRVRNSRLSEFPEKGQNLSRICVLYTKVWMFRIKYFTAIFCFNSRSFFKLDGQTRRRLATLIQSLKITCILRHRDKKHTNILNVVGRFSTQRISTVLRTTFDNFPIQQFFVVKSESFFVAYLRTFTYHKLYSESIQTVAVFDQNVSIVCHDTVP